jgi:CcmD family protein
MNLSYLFAAFALVWIAVLFYVTSLARRGRELEREIEELRALLAERDSRRGER